MTRGIPPSEDPVKTRHFSTPHPHACSSTPSGPGAGGKWRPGGERRDSAGSGGSGGRSPEGPRLPPSSAAGHMRRAESPAAVPPPVPSPPAPPCPIAARRRHGGSAGRWCRWRPALRRSRCCRRGAGGRVGGCGGSAAVPARPPRTVSARAGGAGVPGALERAELSPFPQSWGAPGSGRSGRGRNPPVCRGTRLPCPGCSRHLRQGRL